MGEIAAPCLHNARTKALRILCVVLATTAGDCMALAEWCSCCGMGEVADGVKMVMMMMMIGVA
eukprot:11166178-Lingulodinium_polyedra.AAC.1